MVCIAAGLWLVIIAQPLGRPRPDLARRLHRLSAQGRMELDEGEARDPVFESALLERALRPLLDEAGLLIGAVLRRAGIETGDLDRRLALAMPGISAAQFRGQQLATGLVTGAVLPLLNLLGAHPLGPWPVWMWVGTFAAGFAAPSWQLRGRLRRRRIAIVRETPVALDLLVLGDLTVRGDFTVDVTGPRRTSSCTGKRSASSRTCSACRIPGCAIGSSQVRNTWMRSWSGAKSAASNPRPWRGMTPCGWPVSKTTTVPRARGMRWPANGKCRSKPLSSLRNRLQKAAPPYCAPSWW